MITSARRWAWIHDLYNEGSIINKGRAMIKENFDVILHLNMESTSETHDEAQTAVLQRHLTTNESEYYSGRPGISHMVLMVGLLFCARGRFRMLISVLVERWLYPTVLPRCVKFKQKDMRRIPRKLGTCDQISAVNLVCFLFCRKHFQKKNNCGVPLSSSIGFCQLVISVLFF